MYGGSAMQAGVGASAGMNASEMEHSGIGRQTEMSRLSFEM